MPQNAQNIHVGAARLFIGTIAPVSGAPPTLTAHTSGVPSAPQTGFTELGHTFEDTDATVTPEVLDIESEQAMGIVDSVAIGQMSELKFTVQEQTYKNLQLAFNGIGSVDDVSKTLFYGGGPFTITNWVLILTSPSRINPAKFQVFTVYKAQVVSAVTLKWGRKNPSRIPITVRGIHDATRTLGDQQFQYYIEK